eukprot:c25610_g1_i1 orf=513-968(+)
MLGQLNLDEILKVTTVEQMLLYHIQVLIDRKFTACLKQSGKTISQSLTILDLKGVIKLNQGCVIAWVHHHFNILQNGKQLHLTLHILITHKNLLPKLQGQYLTRIWAGIRSLTKWWMTGRKKNWFENPTQESSNELVIVLWFCNVESSNVL